MSEFTKELEKLFNDSDPEIVEAEGWPEPYDKFWIWPITLGQLQAIDEETDVYKKAAKVLLVRCKTEDGKRIFTQHDIDKLMSHGVGKFGPAMVVKLASAIQKDTLVTLDDIKKN